MMKLRNVFTVLVMMFLIMTICIQATDMSSLHNHKWKVLFRCYDSSCDSYWIFCHSICINPDGFIYNKTNEIKIGKWKECPEFWLYIELYSNCSQLNGTLYFLDSPTIAMEGTGHSYLWGDQKFVKILLVREEPRQATSKKM